MLILVKNGPSMSNPKQNVASWDVHGITREVLEENDANGFDIIIVDIIIGRELVQFISNFKGKKVLISQLQIRPRN